MNKIVAFFFFLVLCSGVQAQTKVIKFNSLEALMTKTNGPIQVINFWATWCGPCVKELPLFEQLNATDTQAQVTLINLDFADKLDKVDAFLARKNMKSVNFLLDEIDYNSWIDKVDKRWEGTIPATLIYNPANGKRAFVQHELKEGELQTLIASVR